MRWVYNNNVYWKCAIRKVFSELSGFKYNNIKQYCHGYIHYSNRRHRQKVTIGPEKVLTLQKPVQVLKKNFRILIPVRF